MARKKQESNGSPKKPRAKPKANPWDSDADSNSDLSDLNDSEVVAPRVKVGARAGSLSNVHECLLVQCVHASSQGHGCKRLLRVVNGLFY